MDDLIIRVERGGESIEIKASSGSSIDDWKAIFGAILMWLTFHPETIKDMFCEGDDCERRAEGDGQ